ncbi:MAG: SDR family NAD(P)-dependent oxidoreductase [Clostridia bacterium]|nr:SDR family NAD(P)-dependent oxidoreductase [Clostridia bacterium]
MNKTLLITGASGGIGQAICRHFAKAGYDIILHYFSSENEALSLKQETEKLYGVKVTAIKADLRSAEEIKSLGKKAGEVDVLINNAGMAYFSLFQLADENKIKELFDLNLMSALSLTKEILPSMISRHSGRIINISSMWGISGASCEVHYSASKAALIGFTKALAKEVGPSGITVNCIAPGFIDTKMNSHLDEDSVREIIEATPMMRKGTGDDVAALALFLAGDEAGFITGQIISVDGGIGI